jgi:hypothetical protein
MSPTPLYNPPDALVAVCPLAEITVDDTDDAGVSIAPYEGVLTFVLNAKATNGTSPTLDIKIQHSDDDGATDTYDDVSGGAFTRVTDADTSAAVVQAITVDKNKLKKYVRVAKDIGGTSSPKFYAAVHLFAHSKYAS